MNLPADHTTMALLQALVGLNAPAPLQPSAISSGAQYSEIEPMSVRENLIAAKELFETTDCSPLQAICDATGPMSDFREVRAAFLAGSSIVSPEDPTALGELRGFPRDVVLAEFDRAIFLPS